MLVYFQGLKYREAADILSHSRGHGEKPPARRHPKTGRSLDSYPPSAMSDRVREQLLGYLLGALDDSEAESLVARLQREPKLRRS